MALKANFAKNNIGLPIPDCYIRIETVFYDSLDKAIRLGVVFYVNQAQRLNDIREKRKLIEAQIETRKAEIVAEQGKTPPDPDILETLYTQLGTLYTQLETVTGESPFYSKVFEFPVTGTETGNFVSLGYQKLKAVNFAGVDDGKLIELDFTKAVDV